MPSKKKSITSSSGHKKAKTKKKVKTKKNKQKASNNSAAAAAEEPTQPQVSNSVQQQKKSKAKTKKNKNAYKPLPETQSSSLNANMVQLNKFENPEYNSDYTTNIKQKMGFRRINLYDLDRPNVFTFKDKPRMGGIPGIKHLIKSEYGEFIGKIYSFLSVSKQHVTLLGAKLNKLFQSLSRRPYGIGKLNIIPMSRKQEFLISFSSILKSKKGKFGNLFHLTFHKSSAFSQAKISTKKGKTIFSNTGSIHIVANHPVICAVDGLKVRNIKQKHNGMPFYEIDDSNAKYNEKMMIEEGELVARIQLGVVNDNNKSYFQVISFNYSRKLNDIFYREILKLVHAFNLLVLSAPFNFSPGILMEELSLTRDDWVVHEKQVSSSQVYAAGEKLMNFYKKIMKKNNMSLSELMNSIRIDSDVVDYNSDIEYYSAKSSNSFENNNSISDFESPINDT